MKLWFARIKFQFKKWLLNKLLANLSRESEIIVKAKKEFDLANFYKDEVDAKFANETIQLLSLLYTFGHTGSMRQTAIEFFSKLAVGDIITPLTFKDDEFIKINDADSTLQNKRVYTIFKDEKGIYNFNAFYKSFVSIKRFNSDSITKLSIPNISTGTQMVLEANRGIATGRGFRKVYYKQADIDKGIMPYKQIGLNCLEIEVKPDQWLTFVGSGNTQLKSLGKLYNIDWIDIPEIKGEKIFELKETYGFL